MAGEEGWPSRGPAVEAAPAPAAAAPAGPPASAAGGGAGGAGGAGAGAAWGERAALRELVRACLSRSEDLALLQRLAAGEVPGAAGGGGAGLQMVMECEYREEWRRGKEAEALGQAQGFTLEHVSREGGRKALADRVLALNEMLEEEDRLARARQCRRGAGAGVGTRGPSPYAVSTLKAASAYGRPSTASAGGRGAAAGARPASSHGVFGGGRPGAAGAGGGVLVPGQRANGGRRAQPARPSTAPYRRGRGGASRQQQSAGGGMRKRAVPTHRRLLERR